MVDKVKIGLSTIPFSLYRINSVGLAEHKYSKKKRLIVDMSDPHDDHTGGWSSRALE